MTSMVSVTATGSSAALSSPSAASAAPVSPRLLLGSCLLLRRTLLAGVLRQGGLKPAEDHEEGDQERAS